MSSNKIRYSQYITGYISPDGKFYSCLSLEHRYLAVKLCRRMKIKVKGINTLLNNINKNQLDAQRYLDDKVWIRVESGNFYWNFSAITQKQINTIYDIMTKSNIKKAIFCSFKEKTFNEFLDECEIKQTED